MNNKTLITEINTNGVAFPADRSDSPRQCRFIPYKPENLLKQPTSSVTYEDIDRLVAEGLVYVSKPYNGSCNVLRTYAGQLLYLETQDWWNPAKWRAQYRKYLCCDKAIPTHCVCIVRTMCPDHESRCNGSHD